VQAGEAWEVAGGYIAVWPSRCLLPVSGALMVLTLLARALADIARILRGGAAR
jgi:TRAP-type mannitol/chloroaromatic compound transport system permease small subunit